MKFRIPVLLASLSLLLLSIWGAPGVGLNHAQAGETAASPEAEKTMEILVLHSGMIVEGQILEETAGQVKIMVMVSGIQAPTSYRTSEILEIQRDIAHKLQHASIDTIMWLSTGY